MALPEQAAGILVNWTFLRWLKQVVVCKPAFVVKHPDLPSHIAKVPHIWNPLLHPLLSHKNDCPHARLGSGALGAGHKYTL